MSRLSASFLSAFTDDLVRVEMGTVSETVRAEACAWVRERFAGAGGLTRAGLAAGGLLLAMAVRLTTGRPYAHLEDTRRLGIARSLSASRLPIVYDWVKAVRSLAVTYVYEHDEPQR